MLVTGILLGETKGTVGLSCRNFAAETKRFAVVVVGVMPGIVQNNQLLVKLLLNILRKHNILAALGLSTLITPSTLDGGCTGGTTTGIDFEELAFFDDKSCGNNVGVALWITLSNCATAPNGTDSP